MQRPLMGSQLSPNREHSQASRETEKNKAEEKLPLSVTPGQQSPTGLGSFHQRLYCTVNSQLSADIVGRKGTVNPEKPRPEAMQHKLTEAAVTAMRTEWEK